MEGNSANSVIETRHQNRFPLSTYYRVGLQLIKQAQIYREEGSVIDLYTTLERYCSLISKMPRHPSYSTYSANEKLHHNKVCQEFFKELENLKPQLGNKPRTDENHALVSHNELKVEYCKAAGTNSQSFSSVSKENLGLVSVNVHCVTQASPSPVISCIASMPQVAHVSHITSSDSGHEYSRHSYQDLHISVRLMEEFLELARDNTNSDLETCGVLGAFLKNGTFYVTTLIIPKQETTSSSCQALSEEEIYAIQSERSLFPVGWIHTHPSQTCFMSSIDLHTQYSYQVMLPEAVAIVMAPTDPSRSYGIFRVCDPGGTDVLKECQERGFHQHQQPSDGTPIYEECSNVYVNPNLRFEIFDLR